MSSPPPQQPLSAPPPPQPPPPPPPPPATKSPSSPFLFKRPPISLTTEFDSERPFLSHKLSTKLLDGLAKLKFSFLSGFDGEIGDRRVTFETNWASVDYDVEENDARVWGAVGVGENVTISAEHHVRAQRGQVGVVANLADPAYKVQLVSTIPSTRLPKVALQVPFAEVSLEEGEEEDKRIWLINGLARASVPNGVCTASYIDGNLDLRYLYKDEEVTFGSGISLPLNTLDPLEEKKNILSIAFKRSFGPSSKLSYSYLFYSNYWTAVFKHKIGKDCKLKLGYGNLEAPGFCLFFQSELPSHATCTPGHKSLLRVVMNQEEVGYMRTTPDVSHFTAVGVGLIYLTTNAHDRAMRVTFSL